MSGSRRDDEEGPPQEASLLEAGHGDPTALTYPPGADARRWIEHYQPSVEEVIVHRAVAAPRISLVVVAYNTPDEVLACLARCRAQNGLTAEELELVIVDNGGNDAVRPHLVRHVDVEVRMTHNVGLCPARNLGVALARAPFVGQIDDDGWVDRDWARVALAELEGDDAVYGLRGRIRHKRHRYFTTLAKHYDLGPRPLDDLLSTEGNSVVRRDAFIAVGGFAENLMGTEGSDLVYRWFKMDPAAVVRYLPGMVMQHDFAHSWAKFAAKARRYGRNHMGHQASRPGLIAFRRQFNAQRKTGRRQLALDQRIAWVFIKAAWAFLMRTG